MMFEELRMFISMKILETLSRIDWLFLLLAMTIIIVSVISFTLQFLGGVGSEVHMSEPEHPHRRVDDKEEPDNDNDDEEEEEGGS